MRTWREIHRNSWIRQMLIRLFVNGMESDSRKTKNSTFYAKGCSKFHTFLFIWRCYLRIRPKWKNLHYLPLIEYADIIKECVIIGANDRLEIWSKELWDKFLTDNEDQLSDIAENLFTTGDFNA